MLHVVGLLRVVAKSLKPVKHFSQQLPTFLLFCDRRIGSVARWGHARSLRMVYQDLWVESFPRCTAGSNIVGSCCICLHTPANTHATRTTSNIVGATMLGVASQQCCVRLQGESMTGFELCATTCNRECKQTQHPTMSGVVGQQCCVRVHVALHEERVVLINSYRIFFLYTNIAVVRCFVHQWPRCDVMWKRSMVVNKFFFFVDVVNPMMELNGHRGLSFMIILGIFTGEINCTVSVMTWK